MVDADNFPEILTVEQAAQLLQMAPETVMRKCKAGELPCGQLKGGRRWYIYKPQLIEDMFGDAVDPHHRRSGSSPVPEDLDQ